MRTKQDYLAQLNTTFSVKHPNGTTTLNLLEVVAVTAEKTPLGLSEPFSALFRADTSDYFSQGTYTLEHESEGELLLFLTPIGPDDLGMRYEAIFT